MYSIVVHAIGGNLTYVNSELSDIKYDNSLGGNGFTIGAVAIGAFSFKCPPLSTKAMATYGIYQGVAPRAQCDFYSNGVLLGTYFVDNIKQNLVINNEDRITISCFDKMAFANKSFEYDNGTKICGFGEALTHIVNGMGCTFDGDINECNFDLENEYTQRDVLSMIAKASGGNFIMSRGNVLRLVTIPSSDLAIEAHTKPTFGAEWKLQQVTVSNNDTQATIASALTDDLYKLDIDLSISDDDVANTVNCIFERCSGHYYIPFKMAKSKVPLNAELLYYVPIFSHIDNTVEPPVTSKPYITQMSMSYTNEQGIDTAYATLSASDTLETRSAFAFDKNKNNVKKDKKLSTVQQGNKYGMKSVYTKTGTNTVGAEEPSKKYKAQFDKAEISFTDITSTETDLGKVYIDDTDTVSPSLNMTCKGLKTTAQDIKGAINELFSLGGSYQISKEWLTLPPALTGEITMLVNDTVPLQFYFSNISSTNRTWTCTVDWGDGIVENYNGDDPVDWEKTHSYTTGGHQISNGTKQYVVTIKNMVNCKFYNYEAYSAILLASINCDISAFEMMFEYSRELCQVDILSGAVIPRYFCECCCALKVVNLCNTISIMEDSAFEGCNSLEKINLKDCMLTAIGANCFYQCYCFRNIDLSNSNLTIISQGAFAQCSRLEKVILPSTVTSIQSNAFGICHSLNEINIPSGCTIENGAFNSCSSLHPTPV